MNDLPRQKLRELVDQYGYSLCDDPRRCGALLKDHCGQYKQEIFVLVNALEKRVAEELINTSANIPQSITLGRLIRRLEDELGLTEAAAKWAVETWAIALSVISQPIKKPIKIDKPNNTQSLDSIIENNSLSYFFFYNENKWIFFLLVFFGLFGIILLIYPNEAKEIINTILKILSENLFYSFISFLIIVLSITIISYKNNPIVILCKASKKGDYDTVQTFLKKI